MLKSILIDKKVTYSLIFFAILIVVAILAPFLPIQDPNHFDPLLAGDPTAPSLAHLFGTDDLGRDLLSRIIYGARVSLMVGVVSVGISLVVGLFLGVIAGYVGGVLDDLIMRVVDFVMAIPVLFLILIIQDFN